MTGLRNEFSLKNVTYRRIEITSGVNIFYSPLILQSQFGCYIKVYKGILSNVRNYRCGSDVAEVAGRLPSPATLVLNNASI